MQRGAALSSLASVGLIVLMAGGVSATGTWGRTVDMGFYDAVAQIIPILLLALIIETSAMFGRDSASDPSEETGIRSLFARFFVVAALGEAATLYVLGSGDTTTFLVSVPALVVLVLGWMLLGIYFVRFGWTAK